MVLHDTSPNFICISTLGLVCFHSNNQMRDFLLLFSFSSPGLTFSSQQKIAGRAACRGGFRHLPGSSPSYALDFLFALPI
jgi:hypothetical protein